MSCVGLLLLLVSGCATDTTPVYGRQLDLERGCWQPVELVGFVSADTDVYVDVVGVGRDPQTGDVYLLSSATYIEPLGWQDCLFHPDRCDLPDVESPDGGGYPDCGP